jgi:hypothetical protein
MSIKTETSYYLKVGELYVVNPFLHESVELHKDKLYAYEYQLSDFNSEKDLVEELEGRVDALYKQGLSATVVKVKETTTVTEEINEMNFFNYGAIKTLVKKGQVGIHYVAD